MRMRFSGHLETQCGTEEREQEGPGCSSYLYNLFLAPSKSVGFARPTFLPLESGDGGAGVVKFKDSKTGTDIQEVFLKGPFSRG